MFGVFVDGSANGVWLLLYWCLMLLWVMGVDLRAPAQFQGSEMRTQGQSKILTFSFVFGVNQEN